MHDSFDKFTGKKKTPWLSVHWLLHQNSVGYSLTCLVFPGPTLLRQEQSIFGCSDVFLDSSEVAPGLQAREEQFVSRSHGLAALSAGFCPSTVVVPLEQVRQWPVPNPVAQGLSCSGTLTLITESPWNVAPNPCDCKVFTRYLMRCYVVKKSHVSENTIIGPQVPWCTTSLGLFYFIVVIF